MSCPVGVVQQFSKYALCSPNLWMIIACTFMTLLTMMLLVYLNNGFKRDVQWLRFAHWKLQQLAERLRYQEPNVTLLERITRRVNEKNVTDDAFEDFFRKSRETAENPNNVAKPTAEKNSRTDEVVANVKKAKEEDAAKVLRDTHIENKTPVVAKDDNESASILKKWTDATKDIVGIESETDKRSNKVDKTQDTS